MPCKLICIASKPDVQDFSEIFHLDPDPSHITVTVLHGQTILRARDRMVAFSNQDYRWSIARVTSQDVIESTGAVKGRGIFGFLQLRLPEARLLQRIVNALIKQMSPAPEDIDGQREKEELERLGRSVDRLVERIPRSPEQDEEEKASD